MGNQFEAGNPKKSGNDTQKKSESSTNIPQTNDLNLLKCPVCETELTLKLEDLQVCDLLKTLVMVK